MTRGRFAPSPTGRMHLGNVFCALLSWLSAKSKGGEWVLRIEDLDPQRSRREYALQLMDDLQWLGLPWDGEPVWQSQRGHIYEEYLHRLTEMGLTYPCFCTRADIMATQAPHETDGRVVYKGTCRPKDVISDAENDVADTRVPTATNHISPAIEGGVGVGPATTRLIVPDCTIPFTDGHYGRHDINLAEHCGDYIIRRKDGAWAYQLAVVVDDALMGVTEIVRGRDLLLSSPQQIHLRELLFGERKTENGKRKTITGAARSVPTTTSLTPQTVPLRQGANEVFREMTECHFVPHEGSTIQCDAGPVRERSGGGGLTPHPSSLTPHLSPSETGGVPQSGEGVDNSLNVNSSTIIADTACRVPTTTSLNAHPSPLTAHLSPSETGGVPRSGEGVDNSLNVNSSTIIADTACRVPTATSLNVYPSSLTAHRSPFNAHRSPLTVNFLHHPLLCNAEGQRLCKRDKSMDLGYLRDKGTSPQKIIGLLAHLAGLTDTPAPISPQELIPLFSWDKVPTEDILLDHRITL